jgi:hypothetical protein
MATLANSLAQVIGPIGLLCSPSSGSQLGNHKISRRDWKFESRSYKGDLIVADERMFLEPDIIMVREVGPVLCSPALLARQS